METISIRIKKKEKEFLEKQSKLKDTTVSEYVRTILFSELKTNYIYKKDLISILTNIAVKLGNEKINDKRIAKIIKKEFEKIWALL